MRPKLESRTDRILKMQAPSSGAGKPCDGEGRDVAVEAFAVLDVALTIERQVQAGFWRRKGHKREASVQHVHAQSGTRERLANRFAGPTEEHQGMSSSISGHVFADQAQSAVATA